MYVKPKQGEVYNGAILEPPKPSQYVFGGMNGIAKEIFKAVGEDWRPYLPSNEIQAGVYFDTWACVTFSALNCLETILNYKIANGLLPVKTLQWLDDNGFIDAENKVNFSDRFTAKMSGTKIGWGNTGFNVAQAILNYGLISEPSWDYPRNQRTPVFDQADYYRDIPDSIVKGASSIFDYFNINYEIVYKGDFAEALKYGPLQVFVTAWYFDPETGLYYSPDGKRSNHAVEKPIIHTIYDSYDPFLKQLTEDYDYYYVGYQYYITNKLVDKSMELKENYLYKLVEGNVGRLGIAVKHDGKLVLLTHKDENEKFNVYLEAVSRNKKPVEERLISVNMADWNSVNHFNLKKQELDENYVVKQ